MENTITIKIEGLKELTEAVFELIATMKNPYVVPMAPPEKHELSTPKAVPIPPGPETPPAPVPIPPGPETPPAPVPVAAPAPTYTIEQLQRATAPLIDAGKLSAIQGLMQSMGIASLFDLPKEQYGEFAEALREMGAQI